MNAASSPFTCDALSAFWRSSGIIVSGTASKRRIWLLGHVRRMEYGRLPKDVTDSVQLESDSRIAQHYGTRLSEKGASNPVASLQ
ncbi:hypothetical protein DPMN_059746 [Dreissena polymorpha]|uniref:Uncharacterized protein n=1 Tax=Dreissena polymorpha TaxID=45954 RepID=A0A9D4C413_DREPO|nr:hypothetical protein DPMN_059746 [Dreissena polymorpha]